MLGQWVITIIIAVGVRSFGARSLIGGSQFSNEADGAGGAGGSTTTPSERNSPEKNSLLVAINREKLVESVGVDVETTFADIQGEATAIVHRTVVNIVGKRTEGEINYDPKAVQGWIERINTESLDKLQELSQNFKFIVSTTVVQKNGAGIHVSSTCFWEQATDGNLTLRWQNKSMYVIIQVFGLTY